MLKQLLVAIADDEDFRALWEADPWSAARERFPGIADEVIEIAIRGNVREIQGALKRQGETGIAIPLVIIDN